MTERERRFEDAARVVDESFVMRAIVALTAALTLRQAQGHPERSRGVKGPLYLVAAAAGIVTHVMLLQFIPDRIAPVKPLAYWMVVAFGAFVAVAGFHTTRSSKTAIADNSAGTANTRNN